MMASIIACIILAAATPASALTTAERLDGRSFGFLPVHFAVKANEPSPAALGLAARPGHALAVVLTDGEPVLARLGSAAAPVICGSVQSLWNEHEGTYHAVLVDQAASRFTACGAFRGCEGQMIRAAGECAGANASVQVHRGDSCSSTELRLRTPHACAPGQKPVPALAVLPAPTAPRATTPPPAARLDGVRIGASAPRVPTAAAQQPSRLPSVTAKQPSITVAAAWAAAEAAAGASDETLPPVPAFAASNITTTDTSAGADKIKYFEVETNTTVADAEPVRQQTVVAEATIFAASAVEAAGGAVAALAHAADSLAHTAGAVSEAAVAAAVVTHAALGAAAAAASADLSGARAALETAGARVDAAAFAASENVQAVKQELQAVAEAATAEATRLSQTAIDAVAQVASADNDATALSAVGDAVVSAGTSEAMNNQADSVPAAAVDLAKEASALPAAPVPPTVVVTPSADTSAGLTGVGGTVPVPEVEADVVA